MRIWKQLRLICAFVFLAFMFGCEKPIEEPEAVVDYLLPALRDEAVTKVELTSKEGFTRLTHQGDVWWVDEPIDYRATYRSIDVLLKTLMDAEIGKRITVSSNDLSQVALDHKGDGVTVRLFFEGDQEVTLILGALDFPKDNSLGRVVGVGFTARRYIRMITETSDESYLVPMSLVDLTALPEFWTDVSFFRIPCFRKISFMSGNELKQSLYRERKYGALYTSNQEGESVQVDPNTFIDFEATLTHGRCRRVGTKLEASTQEAESAQSVILEDFMGITYTFRFSDPKAPTEMELQREALQTGFFSDGVAATLIPFSVEVTATDIELNFFDQQVRDRNLALSDLMANRTLYFDIEDVHTLYSYMKGVR